MAFLYVFFLNCELIVIIPAVVSAAGVRLKYRTHRHHCYCLSPRRISVFIINKLIWNDEKSSLLNIIMLKLYKRCKYIRFIILFLKS